jgi:hypothetical protein
VTSVPAGAQAEHAPTLGAPDATDEPWPDYASAIVELVLQGIHHGIHVVLSPLDDVRSATDVGPSTLPPELEPPVWVLTAGDPYPDVLGAEENAARNRELRATLTAAGIRHDPALGRAADGSVWELSVALRGVDRATVLSIAAQHGQLAVFEISDTIACIDVASAAVVTRRSYTALSGTVGDRSLIGPTGWQGSWT